MGGEGAVTFLPSGGEGSFAGELFLEAGGQGLGRVVSVDDDDVGWAKIDVDTIWATVFVMFVVAFALVFIFIFIFAVGGEANRAESNEEDENEAHIITYVGLPGRWFSGIMCFVYLRCFSR